MMRRTVATMLSLTSVIGMISLIGCAGGQEINLENRKGLAQQAYQMRMRGEVDTARETLHAGLSIRPDDALGWYELARLEFYRAGTTQEMDSAQEAIEKALEAEPENVRSLRFAGRIALYKSILKAHENQTDEIAAQIKIATASLEQAVALDPDCHEARLMLVSCYVNGPGAVQADRGRAEQHVEALEQRSPIHAARARCGTFVREEQEQLSLWTGLAERLQDEPAVHENLARQQAQAGNSEEAIESAERALELDPSRSQVLLEVARDLALAGKLEAAEQLTLRYLEHKPAPPLALRAYAHMMLGRVGRMQGHDERPRAALKRARELDPYCWFTMTPPPEMLFESL